MVCHMQELWLLHEAIAVYLKFSSVFSESRINIEDSYYFFYRPQLSKTLIRKKPDQDPAYYSQGWSVDKNNGSDPPSKKLSDPLLEKNVLTPV